MKCNNWICAAYRRNLSERCWWQDTWGFTVVGCPQRKAFNRLKRAKKRGRQLGGHDHLHVQWDVETKRAEERAQ